MLFTRINKSILAFLAILITSVVGLNGQMVETPKFKAIPNKTSVKKNDIVDIVITTTAPDNWHLFSNRSDCPEDDGPIRADITFDPNPSFQLVGGVKPYGDKMHEDDIFNCATGEFRGAVKFIQQIKVLDNIDELKIEFYGQMCIDAESGQCVLVKDKFSSSGIKISSTAKPADQKKNPKIEPEVLKVDTQPEAIEVITEETPALVEDTNSIATEGTEKEASVKSGIGHYAKSDKSDTAPCVPKGSSDGSSTSYWQIFIAALLSGFLGLLTPCVFPMIPMTVSFFMKDKSKKQTYREAFTFAISIIAIYVLLGTVIASIFGANAGNWLSTHWAPNIFFFAIFVFFAASFFGAFELVLPSSLVNKADQQADKGGILGPVFMAVTIALVSFSCTGPIVGTVLVEAAKTNSFGSPIIAMLGFGLAFALPFSLFAIFPSYLKKLPKSGGWLNSVKVCLGFVELALALKFLSVADQTYHWGLLDREVYLSLWIVIFALMGLYLLGKIKFSHDSPLPFLKVPRLILAIATLSFTVYMIPGLWGAPLKFLAGFMPPTATQDFVIGRHASGLEGNIAKTPSYADQLEVPQEIAGYFDYEEAIEAGKELRLPVFIDFTGHGCVNCRKMEEKVWSDPRVSKSLKKEFVVASLYVDDKKIKLPKSQQFIGRSSGDKISTLGDKNAEIQACYFNMNSQPLYVILDPYTETVMTKENQTAETNGYDANKFVAFLKEGLENFRAIHR
ncbi:MAG: cytochrome c biogenesis protein CcdA [Bacteroidia bacterium]|nr:cytochrome c biogenesis protein CcdA [Bacteroidia bacterium]